MVRDSRGRMYVASHVFRGETKVYNADGSFLRTITKRGGGPGEVSSGANLLVMEGDTVYVFDPGSFRVNVFGPEHQLVRELNVPLLRNFDATQTGGQLVVAAAKTVNGIWTTLHLVTPAGVIIRSFGTPTVQLSSNAEFLLWRYVIPNRDGKSIWAAPKFGDYHFEKWSMSGKAEQLFVRQAPWFTPAGNYAVNQWRPGTPPPALIAAMREDSLGRLWFITGVPKGNWKSITTANPRAGQYLTFDAWLEVIDPERAVVIARQRLAVHALGFLGGDLYAYEEDESGVPSVRIFRIELYQPPTNGGYE
jgi:hypothetical protein